MQKKLKKYGNSLVITFSKEEQDIYGLVEGDTIELDEMLMQKEKTK